MPPQCQIMDAPPAPSTTTSAIVRGGVRGRGGRGGRSAGGTSSAPPSSLPSKNTSCDENSDDLSGPSSPLLRMASMELEVLRSSSASAAAAPSALSPAASAENLRPFPPACRRLLYEIPGNSRCVDCGELGPDWASVSYGALLCLRCSGHHRNLGVKTSFVRSVSMDHWSHSQILCMLEGGNHQLSQFFARHRLPPSPGGGRSGSDAGASETGSGNKNSGTHRYRTVAARFYREKLAEHAGDVGGRGEYRGREAARSGGRRRRSDGGSGSRDSGAGAQRSSPPSSPERLGGVAAENNAPLRRRGGEETARPAEEKSSLRRRTTSSPMAPSSTAEHEATAVAAERRRKERNAVRRSMTA